MGRYKNYYGQIMGVLKMACQDDPGANVVAVCLEGGPVTRVESANMGEIVSKVNVFGGVNASIEIQYLTFEQFKLECEEYESRPRCILRVVGHSFFSFLVFCHAAAHNKRHAAERRERGSSCVTFVSKDGASRESSCS